DGGQEPPLPCARLPTWQRRRRPARPAPSGHRPTTELQGHRSGSLRDASELSAYSRGQSCPGLPSHLSPHPPRPTPVAHSEHHPRSLGLGLSVELELSCFHSLSVNYGV